MIEPEFQKIRDQQLAERIKEWTETFHRKNIINADAYMTMNETIEDAFEDVKRKFSRIEAKLKYAKVYLNYESLHDDIKDLSIYSILFDMFVEQYKKTFGVKSDE
jgi:uncharacterized FlaG/YvyC family protein